MSVLGNVTILSSLLYFFVYDSLESPAFILMLAVGLMNRERLAAGLTGHGAANGVGPGRTDADERDIVETVGTEEQMDGTIERRA